MAGEYLGTAVPYPGMALPDLRDPVLSGPGHRALEDAIRFYHQLGRSLSDAGGAVGALLTTARDAHQGEAAEASQTALRILSEPGGTGAEQSVLAAQALEEQGSYVARVRSDMQAADPGSTLSGADAVALAAAGPTTAPAIAGVAVVGYVERHAAQQQAAEAAVRYQDNTNWNLGSGFQAFPAPNGPTPDTSQGATGMPGGASGPAFQIGPAGALGATGGGGPAGGPVGGGGTPGGTQPGVGTGGSPIGLIPSVPGGSTVGGGLTGGGASGSDAARAAGSGGAGSGAAATGAAGSGGTGSGGAGSGGAATGAAGSGGVGSGGAGSGGGVGGVIGSGRVATGAAGTGGAVGGSVLGSATRTPGTPGTPGTSSGAGSVGGGVGGVVVGPGPAALGPQNYRPGGRSPAGSDPESGILSGAPPLPGNGVISPKDPSAADRRGPSWGSAVADGPIDRAPLDRQTPQTGGPGGQIGQGGPAGRGTTPGQGGMPFMGGAGAGRDSGHEHQRPSWLVQDDPEGFWFSGLPPHCDPVITPDAGG